MSLRLYDLSVMIFFIIGMAITVGVISQKYLGDDNVIEEAAEDIIEMKTGVDVDLSPNSPEGKK